MNRRSFIGSAIISALGLFAPKLALKAEVGSLDAVTWVEEQFDYKGYNGICGSILVGEQQMQIRAAVAIPYWRKMTEDQKDIWRERAKHRVLEHLARRTEWCVYGDNTVEGNEEIMQISLKDIA